MSSSESYIKAAYTSLKARISKIFFISISEAAIFIKDAPEKIQVEFDLLKKEISAEASRIDDIRNEKSSFQNISFDKEEVAFKQNKIAAIKAKISKLTKQIEGIN